jgi:hypothetical protein
LFVFIVFGRVQSQYYNYAYNNSETVYPHPSGNYDQYSLEFCGSVKSFNDSTICACSTITPSWHSPRQDKSVILILDPYGNCIDEIQILTDSTEIFIGYRIERSGTKYLLTGNAVVNLTQPNAKFKGMISTLDSNFQLTSSSYFDYGDFTDFNNGLLRFNNSHYVLGFSDVDTSATGINTDVFVTKIDQQFNPVDTFQFGGLYNETPHSINIKGNKLLVSGYLRSDSNISGLDLFLAELDTLGNLIWMETYGFPGDEYSQGNNVFIDESSNIYFCGSTELMDGNFTAWLIKVDSVGNLIWEKKYDRGSRFDAFNDIIAVNQSSLIIAGATNNYSITSNPPNGWLVKMDTSGTIIWERSLSKYDNILGTQDYLFGLHLDSIGNIFTNGYILRGINDANGIYTDNDGWVWKGDSCGYSKDNPTQAMLIIDSIVDYTIYISNLSTDYCTGEYSIQDNNGLELDSIFIYAYDQDTNSLGLNQLQFTFPDTGSYQISLSTTGGDSTDMFVLNIQIEDTVSSTRNHDVPLHGITLFPNPTSNQLIIQSEVKTESLSCELVSLSGQTLHSFELNPNLYQQQVELNNLSNGVYILRFISEGAFVGNKRLTVVK